MTINTISRDEVPAGEEAHFHKFICPPQNPPNEGPLDPQAPHRVLGRRLLRNIDLVLPPEVAVRTATGRGDIRLWTIEDLDDPEGGRAFPSPLIRTVQGDVVHAESNFSGSSHTIHWHGIEPTPMNDGVGHTSFEATSNFTYQFATNNAGTFFYHCHKNTVLHFEMGMYGLLVVDPPDPAGILQAPYMTGGPGLVRANLANVAGLSGAADAFPGFDPVNFVVPYHREALWVPDEFDSAWHELSHEEFMQACDPADPMAVGTFVRDGFLNNFRPDIFVITGVVSVPTTPPGNFPELGDVIRDEKVAVRAEVGETVLIRLLNAGYTTHEYTLGLDAVVIATDGSPFGVPPFDSYSSPFLVPAGTPFKLTTARRIEMLVRPQTTGSFPFTVKFHDWVHGPQSASPKLYHVAQTAIIVDERI